MQISRFRTTGRALRRFRAGEDGIAAIEFAFIAPLLVTLLLGTVGATQSLWANGKVDHAVSTIGDVIAQSESFTDAEFTTLMKAAPLILAPFPTNSVEVDVTVARACHKDNGADADPTIKFFVTWSRSWTQAGGIGNGPQNPDKELNNAPTNLQIAQGDVLIVTKVRYTHVPDIAHKLGTSIDMEETAYHQPREQQAVSYPTEEATTPKTCDQLMANA